VAKVGWAMRSPICRSSAFAAEWMSEKALSIGTNVVASGVHTIFGLSSPVGASQEVTRLIVE